MKLFKQYRPTETVPGESMRKKKYNLENRKHFVYFAIIYTCICVTVMAFTVFFQYRAYTKTITSQWLSYVRLFMKNIPMYQMAA